MTRCFEDVLPHLVENNVSVFFLFFFVLLLVLLLVLFFVLRSTMLYMHVHFDMILMLKHQ